MAGHGHSHGGVDPAMLQAMMEAQSKPKELVSFRAGQLNLSHNGTTVVADKRRGKLSLVQTLDDGLLHLQWVQRPSGQLQETDDILVMQGSAFLEKVPECKTGRVVLLRFKGSSRKRFFWFQEPKDDKDAEYIKKINDFINNPPAVAMMDGGAGDGGMDPAMAGLEGMDVDQQALMDMLRSQPSAQAAAASRPSGATPTASARPAAAAAAASPGSSSASKSGDSKAKSGSGNTANDAALAAMMNAAAREQVEATRGRHSLGEILDAERVFGAGLTDEEIQPLLQFLPEGQRTIGEFRAALRSPQFHQTLGRMSGVLNSSNFGPLTASFGLAPTGNIGVQGFTEAVEADTKRKAEAKAKAGAAGGAAAGAPPAGGNAGGAAGGASGAGGAGGAAKPEPKK